MKLLLTQCSSYTQYIHEQKKVLFVCSNPSVQELLQIYLTDILGYEIKITHSNFETLELATKDQFDAIIIDFSLAEIDETFLKKLRAQPTTQNIPILLLSPRLKWFDSQKLEPYQVHILIFNPSNSQNIHIQIAKILG